MTIRTTGSTASQPEVVRALTDNARRAVDCLRDFAREHGMTHFRRDPLVMDIHRALDAFDEAAALDAAPSMTVEAEDQLRALCVSAGWEDEGSTLGLVAGVVEALKYERARNAALARSAPAETPEKAKNDDDDHARVDGVPSDRALGSTASNNEVK